MFTLTDCLAILVVCAIAGAAFAIADRAIERTLCVKLADAVVVAGDCR